MKIIDSHMHVDKGRDEKNLLAEMKKDKINKSVLIGWELGNYESTTENCIKISDNHKGSFAVVGSVKIAKNKNFKKDLQNLESLAQKNKIVGIKCYLGYEHFYANDKFYYSIAEVCVKNKIAMLFHTGDVWTDENTGGLKKAKVRFAHPLYIDDIATDFPDLNIIICHFGNPWMMDAAEVIYKNKNVYADLSALDIEKKWDNGTKKRVLEAIDFCGGSKLLFGSDFPLFPADIQIKMVKSLGLSKKDLELTFHGNAEKLFF